MKTLQNDYLPTVETYRKLLNIASIRYNITLDECRNRFGLYTSNQWNEMLNQKS